MKAKTKQYIENVKSGFLKTKTEQVLSIINNEPGITIHKLRSLGFSHQTLTSRISYLQDLGLIRVCGDCKIEKKHYSKYSANMIPEIIEYYQNNRQQEKLLLWLKRGKDYNLPESLVKELNSFYSELNDSYYNPKY
tara:strand:+ start:1119 stop:1526 length:408 start_codon:yes stop_codon:yes gene_type:complete